MEKYKNGNYYVFKFDYKQDGNFNVINYIFHLYFNYNILNYNNVPLESDDIDTKFKFGNIEIYIKWRIDNKGGIKYIGYDEKNNYYDKDKILLYLINENIKDLKKIYENKINKFVDYQLHGFLQKLFIENKKLIIGDINFCNNLNFNLENEIKDCKIFNIWFSGGVCEIDFKKMNIENIDNFNKDTFKNDNIKVDDKIIKIYYQFMYYFNINHKFFIESYNIIKEHFK